jgi:PAS domain S-box-containing protein
LFFSKGREIMKLTQQFQQFIRQPADVCTAAAGMMALLSWLSWFFNDWRSSALDSGSEPMASSTAISMMLLSGGVLMYNQQPSSPKARQYVIMVVIGVAAISLIAGLQFILGFELPGESWPASFTTQVGNVSPGLMSPLSAAILLCLVIAICLKLLPGNRHWMPRLTAKLLAWTVLLTGLLGVGCYALGMPNFFQHQSVPMTLPAAISFALLGVGIHHMSARKITQRKRIENQSQHSAERQRLYFEQSALAIIEWDSLFRISRWNPAAERIFGYLAEEAIGQFASFLVPPAAANDLKKILMHLSVEGDSLSSTNKVRTKDGRIIACKWNNTPLTEPEGKFLGAVSLCEEITGHEKLEEELERLAAVVRNCSELVMITTTEGKMVFLNDSGCDLLGINYYNVPKQFFADVVADPLRERVEQVILPSLLQGNTWKGELQYRNLKTRKLFDVQATTFGIRDPLTHKTLYFANISLDITERKRSEASLREKERKLQLFLQNVSDFIWTTNFSGKAFHVSPSVKQLLGYEPEEFSQFTFKDYLTPASAQFALNRLDKAIAAIRPGQFLEPDTFELEHRRKDGTLVWVEVHCNGMYDEQGALIGIQGISRDISKRKRAEEMLRQSERRRRLFAENANAILWEMDFSGRYTYLSPSIVHLLGYTPEEALQFDLGRTMTVASAKSARKCYAEALDAIRNGRSVPSGYIEVEHYRKDGSTIWTGIHYSVMCDEAGQPIGIQGITIDINAQKQCQAELAFKNVLLRIQQEVSIDGILAVDGDNKVILRNQRFNDIWCLPPDISVAEDDTAVLPHCAELVEDPEAFLEKVYYLYGHRHENIRDEIVLKDGRVFDRYSAPMFGDDENYYGRIWFFRDITECKHAEDSLRKSEERYRTLFENMTEEKPEPNGDWSSSGLISISLE